MIKLYTYCPVLIIGNVEVGLDIGMKFHQEVMEIVSYDIYISPMRIRPPQLIGIGKNCDDFSLIPNNASEFECMLM